MNNPINPATYRFVPEWRASDVAWQQAGRDKLNKIIRLYNAWQRDEDFDREVGKKVLVHILEAQQTWAKQDGGEEWLNELNRMEEFICQNLPAE